MLELINRTMRETGYQLDDIISYDDESGEYRVDLQHIPRVLENLDDMLERVNEKLLRYADIETRIDCKLQGALIQTMIDFLPMKTILNRRQGYDRDIRIAAICTRHDDRIIWKIGARFIC